MEDPLGTEAAHFDEKFVEGSGGAPSNPCLDSESNG